MDFKYFIKKIISKFKLKSVETPLSRQQVIENKYKNLFPSRKIETSNITMIGEYQLKNLLSQPVKFTLFDFRIENMNPQFKRSQSVTQENFQTQVGAISKDSAIVCICKDGETSLKFALQLEKMGYVNVVVLKEGVQALTAEIKDGVEVK